MRFLEFVSPQGIAGTEGGGAERSAAQRHRSAKYGSGSRRERDKDRSMSADARQAVGTGFDV
jgi:hypothetical protein